VSTSNDSGSGVALFAAKGSPGVSTTALLLAALWRWPATLVEADAAGGDLRYWFTDDIGQPLRPDLGVVSLLSAHAASRGPADRSLTGHTQVLPGGLPVLVGPGAPEQAETLQGQWSLLAQTLTSGTGDGADVLVDLGRYDTSGPEPLRPVLQACRLRLLVCRATDASVGHSRDLLDRLRRDGLDTRVLFIGRPADAVDVARALRIAASLVHQLPLDTEAAAGVAGAWTKRLHRSPLVARARLVIDELTRILAEESVVQGLPYPADTSDPARVEVAG
jgi:hypothetical protein